MITLVSLMDYGANCEVLDIRGLSTDIKPTDKIEGHRITNGSTFLEIDTWKVFMFDEEHETWLEVQ